VIGRARGIGRSKLRIPELERDAYRAEDRSALTPQDEHSGYPSTTLGERPRIRNEGRFDPDAFTRFIGLMATAARRMTASPPNRQR
jgi:hypothetical protein